jgi:glutamine amidotransferase
MRILVLDLGINNINSVVKSLSDNSSKGDTIEILSDYRPIVGPSLLVLPGLGKFDAAMDSIRRKKFDAQISENLGQGGFLFGICLGMQLLMSESEESPGVKGLDLIKGGVRKLQAQNGERIPNVGWNSTKIEKSKTPFNSLSENKDFYFVHSFAVDLANKEEVLATSVYGETHFTSAILSKRILGFQFHPEKSSLTGAALIREVVNWSKDEI